MGLKKIIILFGYSQKDVTLQPENKRLPKWLSW